MSAEKEQQHEEVRRGRFFPWLRLSIAIPLSCAFVITGIAWLLSSGNIIPFYWSYIITVIFMVLSVVLPVWQWLFSPSTDSERLPTATPPQLGSSSSDSISAIQPDITTNQLAKSAYSPTQGPQKHPTNFDPIFLVNAPLTDSKEFYGRELERMQLLRNVHLGVSTSIVGPRRVGKTWLISCLRLIAPAELGNTYRIGYIDVSRPIGKTVDGFMREALKQLGCNFTLPSRSKLNLLALEDYVETLKSQQQTAVLCIDEFEGFNNKREFTIDFFEGLRAITQNGLILVTASRKPLKEILVNVLGETSPFFNVFYPISLSPFREIEAQKFVEVKSNQAKFNDEEHTRFLRYGLVYGSQGEEQWPPLRLQLVGQMLLDEKNAVQTDPNRYRPNDSRYWQDFKRHLEENYAMVVR